MVRIWCHIRATNLDHASARLKVTMSAYANAFPDNVWSRIVVCTGSLESQSIGLVPDQFRELQSQLTHIIHAAYPVNFTLPFRSFISQIAITHALLSLSLHVTGSYCPYFIFCSSIAAAIATPGDGPVNDSTPTMSLDHAFANGYARSKLVCEHIIRNAASTRQITATIFRIGQIVPSLVSGKPLWNPNEAVPLMIRSAITMGMLPNIPGNSDACSWLPADIVARAILDLSDLYCGGSGIGGTSVLRPVADTSQREPRCRSGERIPRLLYNLLNPRYFSWQKDVISCLRNMGLSFRTTSYKNWVANLRLSNPDARQNPSIKLLGFWEEQQNDGQNERPPCEVRFDTQAAQRDSVFIRDAPDIVRDGYLEGFIREWLKLWA